ncbi:unnamed protein product [Lepeophtheirus salmonis]|uniref:(salmon louse) hypothetical protein n=1 Tax=Lepeophtheirus salmonis TaxID=72036 RepID=A0A7R8D4S4_LEPSM|nr:unnamed protein product [Lepeophtheirus salmonis]CAF3028836.1 unnamed protein product [Lepeophtheirus salmonis]
MSLESYDCEFNRRPTPIMTLDEDEHQVDDTANAGKLMSLHSEPQIKFLQEFTLANIVPGFRSTEIYTMEHHIFPDHKFLPPYSKDRHVPITNRDESDSSDIQQPLTCSPTVGSSLDKSPSMSSTFISPKEIRPFPKAPARHKPKRLCYDSNYDNDANNALDRIPAEQTEEYDELDIKQDYIDDGMME